MKNEIDERKVADIIHTVGLNNNLMDSQIREIVESQFRFTYKTIKAMSLSTMTDEEIDELKTNFYYKYLGKVYTNSEVITRHKIRDEYIMNKHKQKENGRSEEFGIKGCDNVDTDVSS
jgi:hypothetical protein